MNKKNLIITYENGILYGQNSTRDPNDPDSDGTPIWKEQTPAEGIDDRLAHKRLMTKLCLAYDQWVHNEKYNKGEK